MRQQWLIGCVCLVGVCLSGAAAWASPLQDAFFAAFNKGLALHKQGKPKEAVPHYERAKELAPRAFGANSANMSNACTNLAIAYRDLGQYAKAEPLFLRSLKIREAILDADDPAVAESLNLLGVFYAELGQFAKAEPLLQRGLKIREARLGLNHDDVAESLNSLGALYGDLAQYDKAQSLQERSLKIRETNLGPDHPKVAQCLYNLAALNVFLGEYSKAEPLYQRCLKIHEATVGPNHLQVAYVLGELADLYTKLGQHARAEELQERSLNIKEAKLGPNHQTVAAALTESANRYSELGQIDKAVPLYQRSLGIYEATFGTDHQDVALVLGNLANCYTDHGQHAKAEPLYLRNLKIMEAKFGLDHPKVALALNNLGWLYHDLAQYAKAEPLYERSLKIRESKLGPDHPSVAGSLNNLAAMYTDLGQYAKAAPLYQRSLKIREAKLSPDHPDVAKSLSNLAILAMAQDQPQQAGQAADRCRRVDRRYVSRILPMLPENEQRAFLKSADQRHWNICLSTALQARTQVPVALSAAWIFNGKADAPEAMAQRALLARDSRDPKTGQLARQLTDLRRQLATLTLASPKSGEEAARLQQIARLTEREQELSRQLGRAAGRPARDDSWVSLDEVRQNIPADGVLIDIARFDAYDFKAKRSEKHSQPARYAAWIVPPRGDRQVSIVDLGEADPIEKAIEAVRNALKQAPETLRTRGEEESEQALRKPLEALAKLVLHPLLTQIGQQKSWIVSPDASLWLVPWAALPLEDGSYATEKHQFSYVVSGRDLVSTTGSKIETNPPVVMADPNFDLGLADAQAETRRVLRRDLLASNLRGPSGSLGKVQWARLPGTAAEADAIAPNLERFARTKPHAYTDRYALEGVLKAFAKPKIAVLSTHGFFLPDQETAADRPAAGTEENRPALTKEGKPLENPLLRCGLVLAGANHQATDPSQEDGMLTGLEIVGLDLRGCELVVLSACETGLGEVRNGEGVAGLRQAFQLAGAQSVVATLWQIPDRDSALLMNDFFD